MIFFFPRVKTATFAISGWKAEKKFLEKKSFYSGQKAPWMHF